VNTGSEETCPLEVSPGHAEAGNIHAKAAMNPKISGERRSEKASAADDDMTAESPWLSVEKWADNY
jgi:hypothetical protein